MMAGSEVVIWGFLEDIWYWSQNRISPQDPANMAAPRFKSKSRSPTRQAYVTVSPSVTRTTGKAIAFDIKPPAPQTSLVLK